MAKSTLSSRVRARRWWVWIRDLRSCTQLVFMSIWLGWLLMWCMGSYLGRHWDEYAFQVQEDDKLSKWPSKWTGIIPGIICKEIGYIEIWNGWQHHITSHHITSHHITSHYLISSLYQNHSFQRNWYWISETHPSIMQTRTLLHYKPYCLPLLCTSFFHSTCPSFYHEPATVALYPISSRTEKGWQWPGPVTPHPRSHLTPTAPPTLSGVQMHPPVR